MQSKAALSSGDRRSFCSGLKEERRQDRWRVERPHDGQVRLRLQRGLHGRVQDSHPQKDLPESRGARGVRVEATLAGGDARADGRRHRGRHLGQAGLGAAAARRGGAEEGDQRGLGDQTVPSHR